MKISIRVPSTLAYADCRCCAQWNRQPSSTTNAGGTTSEWNQVLTIKEGVLQVGME